MYHVPTSILVVFGSCYSIPYLKLHIVNSRASLMPQRHEDCCAHQWQAMISVNAINIITVQVTTKISI